MKKNNRISAIIAVYHGEKTIEKTLKSLKGIVDEIIVVHDGPCKDNTIKISKKYTKRIYIRPRGGRTCFPFGFGLKKANSTKIFKAKSHLLKRAGHLSSPFFISEKTKRGTSVLY